MSKSEYAVQLKKVAEADKVSYLFSSAPCCSARAANKATPCFGHGLMQQIGTCTLRLRDDCAEADATYVLIGTAVFQT